ncbi:MAG: hypothetical protein EHM48_05985, partial [Planctomycetaceae bacterium]
MHISKLTALFSVVAILAMPAFAEYKETKSRDKLNDGEIAVTKPGNYAEAGKTYVLMNDITSPTTPIFLGNNVTLDLNGHSITYQDGKYEHVPNYSFEDGMKGWDVTNAPGAKAEDQHMIHPLDGKNVCVLPKDQELISPYITLPVANRAYYAMVLMGSDKMKIDIVVEDEKGQPVKCEYTFGDKKRAGCPIMGGNSKLGGGAVLALFWGQPAGKYRVRVKAVGRDAVIDDCDIRPTGDVGVGIVEVTRAFAYMQAMADGETPSFFDYTKPGTTTTPIAGIPVVKGEGTITIKNGVIKAGFEGCYSWGIQSTAKNAKLVVDNVKIVAAGINTNAINANQSELKNSRFEINTPFIISRHIHQNAVMLMGSKPSEIYNCEFMGGQGCLSFYADGTIVHDNLFVNEQTVTNHYSVNCNADAAKIYKNRFEPKIGSGIEIYTQKNCEVYDNTFTITTAPPNNEYAQSDYSTNAIRITDYNKAEGAEGACVGNKVYRNKMTIKGQNYPGADKKHLAMAYGIFMSVGGGQNYIYDNEITLESNYSKADTGEAFAFYVGGSNNGGQFYNNTITTNATPIWVANRYGVAKNTVMYNNKVIPAKGSKPFPAVNVGWWKSIATDVEFYSNTLEGGKFDIKITNYGTEEKSSYFTGWT